MEDRTEGQWDKTKGKVKEAAGDLTDDHELKREGKKDQLKGAGKKAMSHVKDAGREVKEGIDGAR
jgi:uncharacterized protein YjbJ (UPF0337 family)